MAYVTAVCMIIDICAAVTISVKDSYSEECIFILGDV